MGSNGSNGHDGNGSNGASKRDENRPIRDPKTGHFLPGCPPGPGRPPEPVSLMEVVRQRAKEQGRTPEDIAWEVFIGLATKAACGDAAAGKIVLDRLCGAVQANPAIAVQINQRIQAAAVQFPQGPALRRWVAGLIEDAEQDGLFLEGGDDGEDPE